MHSLNLLLVQLELTLTAYVSHKSRVLAPPRKLIEEIDSLPEPPPLCPRGQFRFYIRVRNPQVQQSISSHAATMMPVKVGASPAMRRVEGNKLVPILNVNPSNSRLQKRVSAQINPVQRMRKLVTADDLLEDQKENVAAELMGPSAPKLVKLSSGKATPAIATGTATMQVSQRNTNTAASRLEKNDMLVVADVAKVLKSNLTNESNKEATSTDQTDDNSSEADPIYNMEQIKQQRKEKRLACLKLMSNVNSRRSAGIPIYGADCRASLEECLMPTHLRKYSTWQTRGYNNCRAAMQHSNENWTLNKMIKSYVQRVEDLKTLFAKFVIYVPSVCAPPIRCHAAHLSSTRHQRELALEATLKAEVSPKLALLHPIMSAMRTQFPDPRLIQYDCGKLQTLDRLLRQLKSGGHRVLIFTQMTKMLDVLEAFLNYHGHIYLRLDGSTRVEQRQILMERFNADKRIFVFILSTRSGGVGINLTGADTVIFYDSDWNPTMDAQAQDRCHRIGQTRDVHIYRLVSEKTIEVNILKKANQKRMLSDMAIEGGNFTTTYFKSSTIKDLFSMDGEATANASDKPSTSSNATVQSSEICESTSETEKQSLRALETALAAAEDEQDVEATKTAKAEAAAELAEFDENIPLDEAPTDGIPGAVTTEMSKADLEVQNLVEQVIFLFCFYCFGDI